MSYHLVLGKALDLPQLHHDAQLGLAPRHVMYDLAEILSATVHAPDNEIPSSTDQARARLCSTPEQWTLARTLADRLGPDDIAYCTGEDIGIPLATMCARKPDPPQIALFAHNLDRLRLRLAFAAFRCAPAVSLWLTNSRYQQAFIQRHLRVPTERVVWIAEQTDTAFFTPAPPSTAKPRPIVASVGLEQRDYRTLAAATADLDVAVEISGFSRDARAMRRAFPATLPPNMTRRVYPWPDLVNLYRSANVIVVSLFSNNYCAGLTSFLEAAACQRPVIITTTPGLTEYVTNQRLALETPPGDALALRHAILLLLADPASAENLAHRAYAQTMAHHTPRAWLDAVTISLTALEEAVHAPCRTPV